jgi:hypothetical protein
MSRLTTARALAATIATTMLIAGCATSSPPTIQTGPDAEVSHDGLHRVDNSQAEMAWARPDFDISKYSKILPASAGFEYRAATNQGRTTTDRNRGGPFVIDAATRERFETMVGEVFQEELDGIQNWEFVTEPGPGVLLVRGGLLDIFSDVPPDNLGARSRTFVSAVGQATLVLELRDSETNTVLARSIDRRWAQRSGGQMFESNRVTNTAEVRRLMRLWASRLAEGLDGFVDQQQAAK